MLRVALIGCGKWGKNYIQAVKATGLGTVTTILSSLTIRDRWHQRSNSFMSRDVIDDHLIEKLIDDLLRNEHIDAAIVATHPPLTEKYTYSLLRRGISVMAEKPFTFSLECLNKISLLLEQTTSTPIFLINHQHLFSEALTWINQKIMGNEVTSFQSSAGGCGPFRKYSPLWDYGPHDLSILGYLSDKVYTLGNYSSLKSAGGLKEHAELICNGESIGAIGCWNNGKVKTHRVSIALLDDLIVYDDFDPSGKVCINGVYPPIAYTPPLTLSVTRFLETVHSEIQLNDTRFGCELAKRYTRLLKDVMKHG